MDDTFFDLHARYMRHTLHATQISSMLAAYDLFFFLPGFEAVGRFSRHVRCSPYHVPAIRGNLEGV